MKRGKITQADLYRVLALLIGLSSSVTPQILQAFGLAPTTADHVFTIVGFVVTSATVVSRIFSAPSPPPGTTYAAIPPGTIPVVGSPSAPGGTQVAHIDPKSTVVATIVPKS